MTRAAWKGPFLTNIILPKDPQIAIKTMDRACTIIPAFVGRKFSVHNGKAYIPIIISEQMVNHKLGEFAITRKLCMYKQKDDPKKKKK